MIGNLAELFLLVSSCDTVSDVTIRPFWEQHFRFEVWHLRCQDWGRFGVSWEKGGSAWECQLFWCRFPRIFCGWSFDPENPERPPMRPFLLEPFSAWKPTSWQQLLRVQAYNLFVPVFTALWCLGDSFFFFFFLMFLWHWAVMWLFWAKELCWSVLGEQCPWA